MKKMLLLAGMLTTTMAFADTAHWGYEGKLAPENWGTMENAQLCGRGQAQSPIDIFQAKNDKTLPAIGFHYKDADVQDIVDNGHSLQFDFKKGSSITDRKSVV